MSETYIDIIWTAFTDQLNYYLICLKKLTAVLRSNAVVDFSLEIVT